MSVCTSRSGRAAAVIMLLIAATASAGSGSVVPWNVILFIGDGMGPAQVQAANYYNGGALSFESFPYVGAMVTSSANSVITDSGAAATAMATGHKVNNFAVSAAYPANAYYRTVGEPMTTSLEYSQRRGKSTGLVTTSFISDATPGAFAAHRGFRHDYFGISDDIINNSRPDVLFGGARFIPFDPPGYTVVRDRLSMQALDTESVTKVSGQFGFEIPYEYEGVGDLPHLSEMTETALNILDNDPDGFFLMVEGARIDHAGHANYIEENVHETLEFANAVTRAVDWAAGRDDTLILVTADHETGGLVVIADNGPGQYPDAFWSSQWHTHALVPVYAWGPNADMVSGLIDNTDIFHITLGLQRRAPGDADGNGRVDGGDFASLFAEFGLTGQPEELTADFNHDGIVDLTDFAVLRNSLHPSPPPVVPPSPAPIPEPTSVTLVSLIVIALTQRRKRR